MFVCVYTSAVSPSDGEVDSKKPVNLPRTNGARGFWLPAYYAHSNDVPLLRKDDTPGHSLMRHSPTTALVCIRIRQFLFHPPTLPYGRHETDRRNKLRWRGEAVTFQASVRKVTLQSPPESQLSLTQFVYTFFVPKLTHVRARRVNNS